MTNAFGRIGIATLATMLLGAPRIAEAGITYTIQNYPADQNGATLSGTITTDGTIGDLASSDILSWTWTITPTSGPAVTLTSSDLYSETSSQGSVVASSSEITIGPASLLNLFNAESGPFLTYDREGIPYPYQAGANSSYLYWLTSDPSMNGSDPWVIAVASVPEPSSLVLAGLGAVCSIAYRQGRRRGSRCRAATN